MDNTSNSLRFYRLKRVSIYAVFSLIVFIAITTLRNQNTLLQGVALEVVAVFGFSFGILLGILDDLLLYSKLSRLNYLLRTILKITFIPIFIYVLLVGLELFYQNSLVEENIINNTPSNLNQALSPELFHPHILFNVYFAAFIITIFNEINLILGDSFIFDYIRGNVKGPTKEERIFMFMDLKDSTTIAEEIGDIHFFELLNDCYTTLGISSIKYKAEIVKYVGDEAILTWKYNKGIKDNNCIEIFQDFKHKLTNQKPYFINKYGLMPRFTASAHAGSVITAYLGTIKRQKDYSGDVMNTTARIEGLNNQLKSEFLISETLYKMLHLKDFEKIESIPLKGKAEPINIYKIS